MTRKNLLLMTAAGALAGACLSLGGAQDKAHKLTVISPRKLADSLHAVIAADQQAYAALLVQPAPADAQPVPASANSRPAPGSPSHAQLLRSAAQAIQKRGAEFSYTLRSLWPINESQGPQTQVEQTGLEQVAAHPEQNYYTEEELGGRSYFTAVYAERATQSACVECHNRHPRSPRHDFVLNEVMGAIVVRVPLEF
jgi:hypothetical protein